MTAAAAAALVRTSGHAFMARYVIEALDSDPALVTRMAERGARIFVIEPDRIHDETVEVDDAIARAFTELDVGDTQLPIYIVQIEAWRVKDRWGDNGQPITVRPARGLFLGLIGLGEGGAIFLSPDLRPSNSVQALAQLREYVS